MDLFKHIIKLISTNCITIKEISHDIQKPPIIYTTPIPTPIIPIIPIIPLDNKLKQLKLKLKELTLYINDLIKIYVTLYNIINLIKATVKHNVYEVSYILDHPNEDYTGKIPLDYTPLTLNKLNSEIIDNLDINKIIEIGKKLINISNKIKKKIGYWLKYGKSLIKYLDMNKLTSSIVDLIIPAQKPIMSGGDPPPNEIPAQRVARIRAEAAERTKRIIPRAVETMPSPVPAVVQPQVEPTVPAEPEVPAAPAAPAAPAEPEVPKVIEVYDNIVKIRKLIDGITQLNVDIEIPYGTSLKIEDAEKNLLVLQNNLEKLTMEYGKKNNSNELSQKYSLNKFEQIPNYYGLPPSFISQIEKKSDLPNNDIKLDDLDKINIIIDTQIQNYNTKTNDINKMYIDITDFLKKIDEYKKAEIKKYTGDTVIYPFSNVGLASDIVNKIAEINLQKINKETELQKITDILNILINNREYLTKKTENENIQIDEYKTAIGDLIEIIINSKPIAGPPINIPLDLFDNYFTKLKTTNKFIEKKEEPVKLPFQRGKQVKQEPKKEEPQVIEKIMPDYTEGLFLKFDKTKNDNIFTLLENKNFNEVYNLLKELHTTLNFVTENSIDENLIRAPKLFSASEGNAKYPYILNIIKKQLNNEKTPQLKKINANFKEGSNIVKLKELAKSLETFTETPELLEAYNKMKQENIDFTKLDEEKQKYEQKKQALEAEILSITTQSQTLKTATTNIAAGDLNLDNAFDFDKNIDKGNRIMYFKRHIINMNNKIKNLKLLNESKNLEEGNIINVDWLKQIGGGVDEYKSNLTNINKITNLNENIRTLLNILENYKSNATDLLNKYNEFVHETYNILVYLLYKITAFDAIKLKKIQIDFKFYKSILTELKDKISNIKRINFNFIKELYINIINNIITKLETSGLEYIEYKNFTNKEALINIIIMTHLYKVIDNF